MFSCFTHLPLPEIGLFSQWYKNYVTVCRNRSALLKYMLKWEAEVVFYVQTFFLDFMQADGLCVCQDCLSKQAVSKDCLNFFSWNVVLDHCGIISL